MLFPKETKENNSRYREEEPPTDTIEPFVPTFDPNVEEVKPLEIDDAGRAIVDAALVKSNNAYKYFNAQNTNVREAQAALRKHHASNGNNNPEYVGLANVLNTTTQEMNAARQDYELFKAEWENAKRRLGKKLTF